MAHSSTDTVSETRQPRIQRALSSEPYQGLHAILNRLSPDGAAIADAVAAATSYEDLLGRLGYRINLTPQIHVNDSYTRVGAAGGIKAVLPYHDIATQSSLPTLVHFDSTVTTTPQAVAFFTGRLTALKAQLSREK
jgi:hypothetical protein